MSRAKKGRRKKGGKKKDHKAMQATKFSAFGRVVNRPIILTLAFLAVFIALTLAVYLPGLSGPLLLDDTPQLSGLLLRPLFHC